MSQGKSKTTTTQTRNVAGPSADESLLQAANVRSGQAQSQALLDAIARQNAYENSAGYQQMSALGGQAATGLQGLMQNGMLPTGQQQSALQQYFQSIMQPQQQQMQQVAQQEAARRGMTISDSPIGNPYLQQLANYNAQMAGQQAGQGLQLGQNLAGMYQNTLNFGNQLQQNAMQNRLALTNAQPGSYGLQNNLANQRINSAPITTNSTTTNPQSWMQNLGAGLDIVNKGMTGAKSGLDMYTGGGTNPVTGRGYSSFSNALAQWNNKPPTPLGYGQPSQPYSLGVNTQLQSPWG